MAQVTPLERAAARLQKRGPSSFDSSGRRVIRHDAGKLPEILDACQDALAEQALELNVFSYANRLARIYQASMLPDDGVRRAAGAVMVHPIEAPLARELIGRAAIHEKFDARSNGYKPCDPPRTVAEALLARGHWPALPELSGFIEGPTITLDGRIIDEPGYDAKTGLFGAFTAIPGYRRPAARPTQDDAEKAVAALLDLFKTFPFVGDADRVAMLAGVLTAVVRRVLTSAPLIGMDAPMPGTGKTLLLESLAILATNRRASVLSLGHDDAETEKRLTGVLLAGDAVIGIDNVERPLRGDLLCQVATQQYVRLRPLGASGMLNVPTHALIVVTGNNLSIVGDLKRRVIMVRLDAKTDRPEHRSFNVDHLATVTEQRGEIIARALTIIAAYLAAGAPRVDGLHAYGGFESWDRMVRRPLAWLGLPDPLTTSEALRENDPDLEATRLLLAAWHARFADRPQTAAEVVAVAMEMAPMSGDRINSDLYDALQVVCSEKPNTRRLGDWLRRHRDRRVDGYAVYAAGSDGHRKVARWTVSSAGSAG